MCAKKHTLLSYHKKTYCPYHDSELSGWDDKVYNVLVNTLETAMIYLTDVGPLMTRKLEKTIPMMLAAKESSITIEKPKTEQKIVIEPAVEQNDTFDYSSPDDEEVMQYFNRWIKTGTSRPQPPAPPQPSPAEQAMLQQQQAMVHELARIRDLTHRMWLTSD